MRAVWAVLVVALVACRPYDLHDLRRVPCKKDGWKDLERTDGSSFKNQGDCIQYLNTGK